VRWNAGFAFLDPVRGDPLLTIRDGLTVDRVAFDGRRARAVVAGGEELGAERIVLCGGAYGSPEILIRSGIGDLTDLPVGENLHDHTGVRLEFQPTAAYAKDLARELLDGAVSQSQVILPLRSGGYGDGFDIHAMPFIAIDDEGAYHVFVFVFLLDPESRGRLSVRGGETELDFARFSVPRDLERAQDGAEQVRALLRDAPEIDEELPEGVTGYAHPVGTCALGTVVGPGLDVLGLESLYVADASIVPRIPRANTNVVCMAIGLQAARLLTRPLG
jgi:choline dehydrogenase-like flavoprotein